MPIDPQTGNLLPIRKRLNHHGPSGINSADAIYFITIAAAERNTNILLDRADEILSSARFYQTTGKWFLYLFLIMPDHIHMLVHIPPERELADVIGHWKSFLTAQRDVRLQSNFFDTRIRNPEHFAEKWKYICQNPVARGLVATPREWPYVIAFDPKTGSERPHR